MWYDQLAKIVYIGGDYADPAFASYPSRPDAPKDALPGHFAEARITTTAEVTAIDVRLKDPSDLPTATRHLQHHTIRLTCSPSALSV